MTLVSGNGKPSIRFTLPAAGAVASIMGVIVFVSGWILGYQTFKAEMTSLRQEVTSLQTGNGQLQARLDSIGKSTSEDRERLTNKLTSMEADIKYIGQGVAELKLKAGTNR